MKTTSGKCEFCKEIFTKRSMPGHLKKCKIRQEQLEKGLAKTSEKENRYIIQIQGLYSPEYWLYLSMPQDLEMFFLDNVLRGLWVECCDHLSDFCMEKSFRKENRINMHSKIGDFLICGNIFYYIYDYGSSTELKLKITSEYEAPKKKEGITLLARNLPPEYQCSVCGEPAKHLCTHCIYSFAAFFCKKCSKKHKCEDTYFLPVVNSPRMGVCGYCG